MHTGLHVELLRMLVISRCPLEQNMQRSAKESPPSKWFAKWLASTEHLTCCFMENTISSLYHCSHRSTMQTVTRRYRTPSPSPTNASRGTWGSAGVSAYTPSPNPASSSGLKRSTTHPSPWTGGATPASGVGVSPAHRSAPTGSGMESGSTAPAVDTARSTMGNGAPGPAASGGRSGEGREVADFSLQKLYVFCRAVRVSIVDGDLGEVVLGSLEGMSMSVAATARELDVNFNLRSLQVDSHMAGCVSFAFSGS